MTALSTCPTTTTGATLRARVGALMSVKVQYISVSVNGKALEDGVTLQEANIHNGCIIALSLQLRGGVRDVATLRITFEPH